MVDARCPDYRLQTKRVHLRGLLIIYGIQRMILRYVIYSLIICISTVERYVQNLIRDICR